MDVEAEVSAEPQPGPSSAIGTYIGTFDSEAATQNRFCLRKKCGRAKLPPAGEWSFKLCPPCLEDFRKSHGYDISKDTLPAISKSAQTQRFKPVIRPAVSRCHFCPTSVLVPPGHPPDIPLLCKFCFEQALAKKRHEEELLYRQSSVPLHRLHGPPPSYRPTPLPISYMARLLPQFHPIVPPRPLQTHIVQPPFRVPSNALSNAPRTSHENADVASAIPVPSQHVSITSTEDAQDGEGGFELLYPESSDEGSMDADLVAPTDELTLVDSETPKEKSPTISGNVVSGHLPFVDAPGSDLSELTTLSSDSEGSSDEEPLAHFPKRSGLKIRIRIPVGYSFDKAKAAMLSEASAASAPQERRCGISRCHRMVDPTSRWKLCDACRLKYRKYQRKRLGVANPRTDVDDHSEIASPESKAVLDIGISRECSSNWCRIRIPLEAEYPWKRCVKCRVRGRWSVKRRRVVGQHYETGDAHVGLAHHVLHEFQRQAHKRRKADLDLGLTASVKSESSGGTDEVPSAKTYPVYQHLDQCLFALRTYTGDFVRAQTLYVRAMLDRGMKEKAFASTGFAFDGEFSLVSGWDIMSKEMALVVADVWKGIESRLGIQLSDPTQPIFEDGAMITRMGCVHDFALHIPPSTTAPLTTMLGIHGSPLETVAKVPDVGGWKRSSSDIRTLTEPVDEASQIAAQQTTTPSPHSTCSHLPEEDHEMDGLPPEEPSFESPAIASTLSEDPSLTPPPPIIPDVANASPVLPPDIHATDSAVRRSDEPAVTGIQPLWRDGAVFPRPITTEVEVRVSEDRRNKFLPGHRIVVRFRLLL